MNAWRTPIDAKAKAKWMWTVWVLSALASVSMVMAVPQIDKHPMGFAFAVSWVVSGFVGLFTQNTLLRRNPWHFRFASWERSGQVYRWVGVEAFCWLLRHSPLGWLNPAIRLTGQRSGLENLLRQMNFAEGAHLIGGGMTLGFSIGSAMTGHVAVALSFAVITLFFHVYPLLTQRWNRLRVARVIQRMGSKLHEKA